MTSEQTYKQLTINDTVYETKYTRKYENRKPYESPDSGLVKAFLPGTVYELLVSEGDAVKVGTKIIRFEAMKMINEIQSATEGVVHKILVAKGDRFSKGTVLMEIR